MRPVEAELPAEMGPPSALPQEGSGQPFASADRAPAGAGVQAGRKATEQFQARTGRSEAKAPLPRPGTERVLVIEDEATVAQLIRDILEDEGYTVEIVLDLQARFPAILESRFSLILCDLKMAGLDGRAFYERLAQKGSPLQYRVAFITGDTLSQSTLAFLKKTGVSCLAKPFLVEDLKEFVRRSIQQADERERDRAATSSARATSPLPEQALPPHRSPDAHRPNKEGRERNWRQ
jgi:CheY-like chemotaxis protein